MNPQKYGLPGAWHFGQVVTNWYWWIVETLRSAPLTRWRAVRWGPTADTTCSHPNTQSRPFSQPFQITAKHFSTLGTHSQLQAPAASTIEPANHNSGVTPH